MRGISIRAVDRRKDTAALQALDTAFSTRRIFKARAGKAGTLRLAPVAVPKPVDKRYILTLDADRWTDGWVLEHGGAILGFIAVEYHEWNRRLVIWHFYVDRPIRMRGFGRRLMAQAVAHGRAVGATTLWAETTNLNYPAVAAYRRLGFAICGFDLSLYRGTPSADEFALFLSRPIAPGRPRRRAQ